MNLANEYMVRYSNDEIRNLYDYLSTELAWMRNKTYCMDPDAKEQGNVNVFDVLYLFASNVLTEEDNQPLCQYIHFLRWHEMTREIDEDSMVTAFLACKDRRFGRERRHFFWKPVIGQNSRALNRILERGLAENHFHLKGSAPLFHISWLSLMNHISNPAFSNIFEEYDKRRLKRNVAYFGNYKAGSLYELYQLAVCIRLYLFVEVVCGEKMDEGDFIEQSLFDKLWRQRKWSSLESRIQMYHEKYPCNYDYIMGYYLANNPSLLVKENSANFFLAGERWFLYQMFYKIYDKKSLYDNNFQLFYIYLLIKNMIRAEMIQVNENIGFDNFLMYQNRKEDFIENTIYEGLYVRMAVRDTIINQHIEKLEARISPKDSVENIRKNIEKLDQWILEDLPEGEEEKLKNKYFYVVHFIKEKENKDVEEDAFSCRSEKKRKDVEKRARALSAFRDQYSDLAQRVLGIDASSSEIGCRPEVFAQAFRFLKNHVGMDGQRNLRATYHVGEDFLDIIDGLRAIDEAILFLDLRCGDRLGHALALGTDVDEWYSQKANLLLMNKMDHLDNLVWLYHKIRKYRLVNCEDAVHYIQKRFDELIRTVYFEQIEGGKENYHFSIESYYDAWKLRGDNPENYESGKFRPQIIPLDEWKYHSINREYPVNYKIRYDKENAYLYYLYHYNRKVKEEGRKMIEVRVNSAIARAVKMVQKRMQIEICAKGIGIETNPSSNCFIGSFKRYDKHPIVKWYNYGLINEQEQLMDCPQLLVSINTDDQGVFNTCLENEYAYIALALEKIKNEDGTPKYNRTMILQWLNNIREMGLDQSFF